MSHTGSLDPLFSFAIFAHVTFLGISTLRLVNHTGSPSIWWFPHAYPLFSVPFPCSSLLSFSSPLLYSLISMLCGPPFDKLGLSLHFVVRPPASVDFLPFFSFSLTLHLSHLHSFSSSWRWPSPTDPCRIYASALDAMGIQRDLRC